MRRDWLGTPLIILRGTMAKLYENREWLYKRYILEKTGIVNMAKEAGCSHMTIQRALEKHGMLKRR